jgi:hypothetical protein
LAAAAPIRPGPADVSGAGAVLPSRPSPWRGLSPPQSTTHAKTPQRHPGGVLFPFSSTSLPSLLLAGASGASYVLRRLSSCLPRPVDSGGPAPPRPFGGARMACGRVNTLGGRPSHSEAVPARQDARSPLRPPGGAGYASPIVCAVVPTPTPPWTQDALRVGGSPFPGRDFHPGRDAKLAWRDNAGRQPLPEAGAERTLEAVSCTPWLDSLALDQITLDIESAMKNPQNINVFF